MMHDRINRWQREHLLRERLRRLCCYVEVAWVAFASVAVWL